MILLNTFCCFRFWVGSNNYRILLQLGSTERFMQESQFLIHGNGKDKPPTGFMFEKQQMKGLYFNQSPTKVCYKSIQSYCHCFYNHPATFAMYFLEIHSDTLTQINMGNSSQHCMASIWPTFPATLVYNKLLLVEWKPTIVCKELELSLLSLQYVHC